MQYLNRMIEGVAAEHPHRPVYLWMLAGVFAHKYVNSGDPDNLEAAIHHHRMVVDLTTGLHNTDRITYLESLASCLQTKYYRFGALCDLEAALEADHAALQLSTQDPIAWALLQGKMALHFSDRYHRLGNTEDLELGLQKYQEAVDLIPKGHAELSRLIEGVATCFRDRYERFGALTDLEASVDMGALALNSQTEDSDDPATHETRRAMSHLNRFRRFGDMEDLETAWRASYASVDLTPEGHSERPMRLKNLSASYTVRYHWLGDLKDLELAIQTVQEALETTPPDHANRTAYQHSLAASLRDRYHRLGEITDLDSAIQMDQEAVSLTPQDHPILASHLQSLATSYADRYQKLGDITDSEAALLNFEESLKHIPEKSPNRPQCLQKLAQSLGDKYKRVGDLKDLEASLEILRGALDLTPEEHPDRAEYQQNVAAAFADRYGAYGNAEDLAAVHNYYTASFKTSSSNPKTSWKAALKWALFAEKFQPSDCLKAYKAAFDQLPGILWMGHTISVRQDAIHRLDIGQATSAATKMCISLSNLQMAVEIMEQGVATSLQQILQLREDTTGLEAHQAKELQRHSAILHSGRGDAFYTSSHANARNKLLKAIRNNPDHQYFLLPKPYHVLCHAAQGGAVVILNSHKNGCDGIIILKPGAEPVHVPLPTVTVDLLQSQKTLLNDALDGSNLRIQGEVKSTRLFGQLEQFTSKTPEECFADVLAWLWTNIHGFHSGRLWWLPTGAFTGLPLHASAPTEEFIHSYTPTLRFLLEASAKKSSGSTYKVGIVGVTHTGFGHQQSLKSVAEEVKKIISIVKEPHVQCLEGEEATVDAVKLQLKGCSWAHLACHGRQDLINPGKSSLSLYGGKLELDTILRMRLSNAQFVFLAACQTAMGDAQLMNESFHLGGGFIAAGFRGAIGTLWSMNDNDGPLVAEIVYSHIFQRSEEPEASEAAKGLQLAVSELKKRKVPYGRWIPLIHIGV